MNGNSSCYTVDSGNADGTTSWQFPGAGTVRLNADDSADVTCGGTATHLPAACKVAGMMPTIDISHCVAGTCG